MKQRRAILLAAGKGTRLHCEEVPKAMYKVLNKPLLEIVLNNTSFIEKENTYVVIGYKKEKILEYFSEKYNFVEQKEQLGTGHAVNVCRDHFADFDGTVLVGFGDMPLFGKALNEKLCEFHEQNHAACTMVTAIDPDREDWAHIIKDKKGNFVSIVEGVDCTPEQKANNKELFAGLFAFDSKALFETLPKLSTDNKQNEYYLTEVPAIMAREGMKICTIPTYDNNDMCGVNTPEDVAVCEEVLRQRIIEDQ